MKNDVLKDSSDGASLGRPRALDTILPGGLVVGILDLLFAFTFYGLILGVKPLRIFQSVAAGLMGRAAAFDGGIKTFLLGILLHFIVATCIAAVYYGASWIFPVLIRHAVLSGLIYGMIAYLGMNYLVIPLSAIRRSPGPLRLPIFLTEIIGHAFLVGLPLALLARRSAKRTRDYRGSAPSEKELSPTDI
ncbi:MAG: hypothetical protein JWM21_2553 [Acidobacteria bacterium]|nr:hypothetical protein [Acidobacteriota bacterium]